MFRPHYTEGIWKRNNHRPFWICVWRQLGQGNHVIVARLSIVFEKLRFENVLSPHENKTLALRGMDFYHLQRTKFPWCRLTNHMHEFKVSSYSSQSNKRRKPAIANKSSSFVKSTFGSFCFPSFLIKIRNTTVVNFYRLLSFIKRFLTRVCFS